MSRSTPSEALRVMELPVRGMDCTECTQHVQHALGALPGVESAEVFLSSEKAVVRFDPSQVDVGAFCKAVETAGYSIPARVIELPVRGMDCTECTQHVQHALAAVPGVESVEVFLASEKAVLRLDPVGVPMDTLRKAVEAAGYSVPETAIEAAAEQRSLASFTRPVLTLFGLVVGAVLLIVVAGEWFGLFELCGSVARWVDVGHSGRRADFLERVARGVATAGDFPHPHESRRRSGTRCGTVADSSGRRVLYASWQLRGIFYD